MTTIVFNRLALHCCCTENARFTELLVHIGDENRILALVLVLVVAGDRPDERGTGTIALGARTSKKVRPRSPGFIFDIIFTLHRVIRVGDNTSFAYASNLKPA